MKANPSKLFRTQSPSAQHWMNIALGRSNFYLALCVNSRENKITIQLWINNEDPKAAFDKLYDKYEQESYDFVSLDIEWMRMDDRKQSSIQLSTQFDFMEFNSRKEQFAWFRQYTEKFIEYFRPKIKAL